MEHTSTPNANKDSSNFAVLPSEVRYPLELTPVIASLRDYFIATNESLPGAIKQLDLSSQDIGDHSPTQLDAAALVWSARSWVEYNGISESEALLVRVCLEQNREIDLKYALTARAAERAIHADHCRQVAESLSYYSRDTNSTTHNRLYQTSTIRTLLDVNEHVDGSLASYLLAIAEFDCCRWEASLNTVSIGSVNAIIDHCVNSKKAQLTAFWAYFEHRAGLLTEDCKRMIAQSVGAAMESQNLAIAIPALAVRPGAEPIREAGVITADAGLGEAAYEVQVASALSTFDEMQYRFECLGVQVERPQWLLMLSLP